VNVHVEDPVAFTVSAGVQRHRPVGAPWEVPLEGVRREGRSFNQASAPRHKPAL
jgi:hypothetical protein